MSTYKRHRLVPNIISCAVWLYFYSNMSQRDIKGLITEERREAVGELVGVAEE